MGRDPMARQCFAAARADTGPFTLDDGNRPSEADGAQGRDTAPSVLIKDHEKRETAEPSLSALRHPISSR